MRVGLILISNRPESLKGHLESIANIPTLREKIKIFAAIQSPFTGNEKFLDELDDFVLVENKGIPIPFTWYRVQAMKIAEKHCDIFWSLDCDHRFREPPGKRERFYKSTTEYYQDVFDHFERNEKAGVIHCAGYNGGNHWMYKFKMNPPNKMIGTDKGGIFFRNLGVDVLIEPDEQNLVGGMFETLCAFNVMSKGYYFAKRFNSPLLTEVYSKTRGYSRTSSDGHNISYSNETLDVNIKGVIRRKFDDPSWASDKDWEIKRYYPLGIKRILMKEKLLVEKFIY